MAMGTRNQGECQEEMWVARATLPSSAGHPFYQRLNQLLEEKHFDAFAEGRCQRFYAEKIGRPSLAPGVYFRLLLIGYFEGIDSERGLLGGPVTRWGYDGFSGSGWRSRVRTIPPSRARGGGLTWRRTRKSSSGCCGWWRKTAC